MPKKRSISEVLWDIDADELRESIDAIETQLVELQSELAGLRWIEGKIAQDVPGDEEDEDDEDDIEIPAPVKVRKQRQPRAAEAAPKNDEDGANIPTIARILTYLEAAGPCNAPAIARGIGVSAPTVYDNLRRYADRFKKNEADGTYKAA